MAQSNKSGLGRMTQGDSRNVLDTTSEISALRSDIRRLAVESTVDRMSMADKLSVFTAERSARLAFEKALVSFEVERLNNLFKVQETFGRDLMIKLEELEEEKDEELAVVREALKEKTEAHEKLVSEFSELTKRFVEERMAAEEKVLSLEAEEAKLVASNKDLAEKLKKETQKAEAVQEELARTLTANSTEINVMTARIDSIKKAHEEQFKKSLTRQAAELSQVRDECNLKLSEAQLERTTLIAETAKKTQKLTEELALAEEALSRARAEHKGEMVAKQLFFDEQIARTKGQILALEERLEAAKKENAELLEKAKADAIAFADEAAAKERAQADCQAIALTELLQKDHKAKEQQLAEKHAGELAKLNELYVAAQQKWEREHSAMTAQFDLARQKTQLQNDDFEYEKQQLFAKIKLLEEQLSTATRTAEDSRQAFLKEQEDFAKFKATLLHRNDVQSRSEMELRLKEDENKSLRQALSEAEERFKAANQQYEQLQTAFDKRSKQLAEIQSKVALDSDLRSELEAVQKRLSDRVREENELRNQESLLRAERDRLSSQLSTEKQRNQQLEDSLSEARKTVKTAAAKTRTFEEQIASLQAEQQALESKAQKAASNADFYKSKYDRISDELSGRNAELKEKLESVRRLELKYHEALGKLQK